MLSAVILGQKFVDSADSTGLDWDYFMNYAYFNIFYLLTLPILGQKLVDSADSTGLVWDYLMNYIYINLFYFQTQLDSHDSAGFDWTPLDSTGLVWTRLDSSGLDWAHLDSLTRLDSLEYVFVYLCA